MMKKRILYLVIIVAGALLILLSMISFKTT